MECDICARNPQGDAGLHCPACARAMLYPHRINHARLLLEKEQLRRQVEATIPNRTKVTPPMAEGASRGREKMEYEENQADLQRSRERIEEIVKKSESLKEMVQQYKQDIQSRRSAAEQRRKEIEAIQTQATKERPGTLERLKRTAKRRNHRYDNMYKDIVTARIFLCKEAADLGGLRRRQRKAPDSTTLESYTINDIPVIDLRDLNNAAPQHVTTSLTSISRLLVQACYYLDIRLPAEITLPGENYPLSTIFSPASSFLPTNKDVTFPGLGSSSNNSPSDSRTIDPQDPTPSSKPRPLYLDRKLTVLLREDPSQYTHFIEGVSLLAWCVAWLCRTQGLPIANTDWEEICAIGRNLWLLLVDAPTTAEQRQQLEQQQQRKDGMPKLSRKGTSDASNKATASPPIPRFQAQRQIEFGTLSHGTAHTPLLFAQSTSFLPPPLFTSPSSSGPSGSHSPGTTTATSSTTTVNISPRPWKFASPTSVRDSLKKFLSNEMSAQEWEVLSSGEFEGWAEDAPGTTGSTNEEPKVVAGIATTSDKTRVARSGARGDGDGEGGASSVKQGPAGNGAGGDGDEPKATEDRPKGSSGWMKLKSRATP